MPKKYNQYFKAMMIGLHASGKSGAELSREYDVSPMTLSNWFAEHKQETIKNYSPEEVGRYACRTVESSSGE